MFELCFFNGLNYEFLLKFILSIMVSIKRAHFFITFLDIQKLGWYTFGGASGNYVSSTQAFETFNLTSANVWKCLASFFWGFSFSFFESVLA